MPKVESNYRDSGFRRRVLKVRVTGVSSQSRRSCPGVLTFTVYLVAVFLTSRAWERCASLFTFCDSGACSGFGLEVFNQAAMVAWCVPIAEASLSGFLVYREQQYVFGI